MSFRTNRTIRIVAGLALLLAAAGLSAGLVSLGPRTATLAVAAVDLALGAWLLASAGRSATGRSPGGQ